MLRLGPSPSAAMSLVREVMSDPPHSSAKRCVKSVSPQRYLIKPRQYPACEERRLHYSSLHSEELIFFKNYFTIYDSSLLCFHREFSLPFPSLATQS